MKKIVHTGDIHLKLRGANVSWYLNRFNLFAEALLAEKPDIVIISGDLFDKVPNILEVSILISFLNKLKCPTYIISGNHDFISRKAKELDKKEEAKYLSSIITALGKSNIIFEDYFGVYDEFVLVANRYIRDKKTIPIYKDKILVSHIRHELVFNGKVKPAEYDLGLLEDYRLVLLSDIHTTFQFSPNIFYSTSPYRTYMKKITDLSQIDNSLFGFNIIVGDKVTHKELSLPNPYKLVLEEIIDIPESENLIIPEYSLTHDQLTSNSAEINGTIKIKKDKEKVINLDTDLYEVIAIILKEKYSINDPSEYLDCLYETVGRFE